MYMTRTEKILAELKRDIGPGVITGASDDDPSGILTYLQSGVVLGLKALWTALITLPLMFGIQEMCARIGLVTRKGIVRLIREEYSSAVLYPVIALTAAAIVLNISADLLAMGVVLEKLAAWPRAYSMVALTVLILYSTIIFSYKRLANILQWLTFSLFFYLISAFYFPIDWKSALLHTIRPEMDFSAGSILLFSAILGTTISPYLFFWQANQEVEEYGAALRSGKFLDKALAFVKRDTFFGMLFSNITMWFIIAGAAGLAGANHLAEIKTFEEASLILQPLLGKGAFFIFSLGILGTGLLVIPVLAGNIGYAAAEIFGWTEGLSRTLREAKGFYAAIVIAALVGLVFALLGFDPVTLLIYSAVFYTVVTPPTILLILLIANKKSLMKEHSNGFLSNFLGLAALALMGAAAIAYLASVWG
jgi:Mn2+/Fe2+ NRAMP family transporter